MALRKKEPQIQNIHKQRGHTKESEKKKNGTGSVGFLKTAQTQRSLPAEKEFGCLP